MTQTTTPNESEAGYEVLKQIGSLEAATKNLKSANEKPCSPDQDDVVNVLTIVGRTILKIFGVSK